MEWCAASARADEHAGIRGGKKIGLWVASPTGTGGNSDFKHHVVAGIAQTGTPETKGLNTVPLAPRIYYDGKNNIRVEEKPVRGHDYYPFSLVEKVPDRADERA